jgi:hypothetical protein
VNTGAPWPTPKEARARVLEIQTKLHRWATDDPDRRFDDLFNLVCDPAFLVLSWTRVRTNKGSRTAGVDGNPPTTSRPGAAWWRSRRHPGRSQGPALRAAGRSGTDDSKAWKHKTQKAGNSDGPGLLRHRLTSRLIS